MKIICQVVFINQTLPSLNLADKKAVRSSLTIGKLPNSELFILHQTNDNLAGRKYKVKDNIKNVFVKFVHEGKATIRFKEPDHTLAIQSDPIQLKAFLSTLKLGLNGVLSNRLSTIQSIQNKCLKSVKTKLKITCEKEYPALEGFPRTLESLLINEARLKRLDSRILRLRSLRILNLENNSLTTLPENLGSSLPNLAELHLAKNCLSQGYDWRWIANDKLQAKLKFLDLRLNEMVVVPDKIVKLKNVVTLKLDSNSIQYLPDGIGCMKSLRYFSASNNNIRYLPSSIRQLDLETIDLSRNNFSSFIKKNLSFLDFQAVPSLLDIAASCVIKRRVPYAEDSIPQTLIQHLESASFCSCGTPCFSKQPESYIRYLNLPKRPSTVISSCDCAYSVAVRFCSFQCYIKQDQD